MIEILLVFLVYLKRGEGVRIGNIIKEKQPRTCSKLHSMRKEEKLTEKDLKELMSHSSFKRSSGAIRQVR